MCAKIPKITTPAPWIVLVAILAGCAQTIDTAAPGYFIPPWDKATRALESALSAWQNVPSPVPAYFEIPSVQFIDTHRKPQQRLLSFQILRKSDVETARQFTVRLNLEGDESPQLVKYNVLGRDPLYVWRLEDLEMVGHWEMNMDEPAPEPGQGQNPKEAAPSAAVKAPSPSPNGGDRSLDLNDSTKATDRVDHHPETEPPEIREPSKSSTLPRQGLRRAP